MGNTIQNQEQSDEEDIYVTADESDSDSEHFSDAEDDTAAADNTEEEDETAAVQRMMMEIAREMFFRDLQDHEEKLARGEYDEDEEDSWSDDNLWSEDEDESDPDDERLTSLMVAVQDEAPAARIEQILQQYHNAMTGPFSIINLMTPTVHYRNRHGETALFMAASTSTVDIVKLLIKYGAKVEASDYVPFSATPLLCAIERGNVEVAKFFIENGFNLDDQDYLGRSPLILAASEEKFEIVESLIESGADVDLRDHLGQTALMKSIACGNIVIFKKLLEAGARIAGKDNFGYNSLEFAVVHEFKEAVSILFLCLTPTNANYKRFIRRMLRSEQKDHQRKADKMNRCTQRKMIEWHDNVKKT